MELANRALLRNEGPIFSSRRFARSPSYRDFHRDSCSIPFLLVGDPELSAAPITL